MTSLINTRYQFDPTGQANSNLIVDEVHSVPQNGARLIIAREGLFYTREFTVRPASGGPQLVLNQDYHYISMDEEITAQTGLETATGIEFDDPALFGDFIITYHAVGGVEGNSNKLMQDLKAAIELAKNSPVDWNKLINVPAQFPPEWHPHEVTDLNGLEAVKDALNRLELAIYDSRPLELSGLNLHWQDQRILHLLATFNDRLNGILERVIDLNIDELVNREVTVLLADVNTLVQNTVAGTLQAIVSAEVDNRIPEINNTIQNLVNTSVDNRITEVNNTIQNLVNTSVDNRITEVNNTIQSLVNDAVAVEISNIDARITTALNAAFENGTPTLDTRIQAIVDAAIADFIASGGGTGGGGTGTGTAPDVTGLTGTPDGVTLNIAPTELDWSDVTDASSYDVYINNALVANVVTSRYVPTTPLTDGTYSWYVVAKNAYGDTQGPIWSFTLDTAVVTTNPPDTTGVTGTPHNVTLQTAPTVLDWTPAANATAYDLYVNGSLLASDLTDTQYSGAMSFNDATTNEWYVIAKNADGTAQSQTFHFILNSASVNDVIYNAGEFGTTPVAGPGEVLEPDTIDAGLNPGVVVVPPTNDTIYNAGEMGTTPVAGPGEVLEPDIIDAGLNPGVVPEPYVGLVVYDAGGISGPTSPIPPGAEIEPDIIDLNPQP